MNRLLSIAALALLLSGCGEARLDGSSEEAFKESLEKISKGLEESKREQFKTAISEVLFSGIDLKTIMSGEVTPEGRAEAVRKELAGKNADEVIAEANRLREARAAREKEQALNEIQEIEAKIAAGEAAKVELEKFVVTKSRFRMEEAEYSYRKKPVIDLAVQNGTGHPVSRAYFRGTIASPGRSVPWLVEEFNYSISGGLEPGESSDWSLAPNSFSEWGKVDAPSDALFTVEVLRLDGADGEALYNARGVPKRTLERLTELKAKFQ